MLQKWKVPYVTFQVVWKHFPVTDVFWELSCCFFVFSCSSLHTFKPITLLQHAAPADQSPYTYMLSDPCWSSLSVWGWILSLTQTAALLQSSVVGFVVAIKSFPSTVALFLLFLCVCLSPKEIGLSHSPPTPLFLLHGRRPITGLFHFTSPDAEWAKEETHGSGNILLEWYFESSSPPSVVLPVLWWNFRMLQQFSVCERKQLTQSKDDSKLQLNHRLEAPLFWIALFSFYSCSGGLLRGKKKRHRETESEQFSLRRISFHTNKNSSNFLLTIIF